MIPCQSKALLQNGQISRGDRLAAVKSTDSASEKFEIIELVEQSSLSVRRTLAPIGIPRSTFYDWYSRYQERGIEALVDGRPRPRRIWNKIPDKIQTAIVNLALEEPDLSPRELAVNFTDTKGSFVPQATAHRLLKDHGLITSPAFRHRVRAMGITEVETKCSPVVRHPFRRSQPSSSLARYAIRLAFGPLASKRRCAIVFHEFL
jgi:transposase-like protein